MADNLPDSFDIDRIGQAVLSKHHHFINHEWKGPDLYVIFYTFFGFEGSATSVM